jgi:hypothetical protein
MYRSPLKLDLYYDTLSPHAWLAFEVLLRYRPVWNIELTCKPVLGADIDKVTNRKELAERSITVVSLPENTGHLRMCVSGFKVKPNYFRFFRLWYVTGKFPRMIVSDTITVSFPGRYEFTFRQNNTILTVCSLKRKLFP